MRDFYLVLNSSVAVAIVILGLVVFLTNKRSRINHLFSLFSLSTAVWVVAACVSNDIRLGDKVSLYGNYLVFMFSYFASFFLLWFVVRLVSVEQVVKRLRIISPFVIFVGALSATPLVVAGVTPQEHVYAVEFGVLAPLYGVLLIGQLIASVVILVLGLKGARSRNRRQIIIIIRALIVALPVLVITQFIAPAMTGSFEITDSGILIMALPVYALYISVFRHGLFDIRLAAIRSVGYGLTIAAMAGVYILLAYAVSFVFFGGNVTSGVGLSPANIAIALILAFIFQPIKHFFDQATNRIFYRGEYDTEEFFRGIGRILSFDTDLRMLLRQTSEYVSNNLKADRVFFYINGRGVFGERGLRKTSFPAVDIDEIVRYYQKHHEASEAIVEGFVQDEAIKRILMSHRVKIVLPLILQKNVIGCLFIGEHKSRGFSPRDVRTLESISNELTIAVQNSLSVEEIRELNQTLQRKVEDATKELRASNRQLQKLDEAKNEFMSMASHQLRTPLTSIKGYLDMVLQGDLGKVNATQKTVLSEAFLSSERMVALINDFLNVSRLQTGKFTIDRREGDLKEVVKGQVRMLKVVAKQHDLVIKEAIDKNVPVMDMDADKLQQVVLNFIDNAIYYSKPKTTIQVKLEMKGKEVEFTVQDTGIGVPQEEQAGLFGKFFRASNAKKRRPDGTGVGLFLTKKVITLHGGQVIFSSEENKGSTFGFRLPV